MSDLPINEQGARSIPRLQDMEWKLDELLASNREILQALLMIINKETIMSKEMDDLSAAFTRVQADVTKVVDLVAQLKAAGNDPAAIEAIATQLSAAADSLDSTLAPASAAVAAARKAK